MTINEELSKVSLVIPMKPLAHAKMRLSPVLDDITRQAVALSMLDHVCKVAVQVFSAHNCTVLGGDLLVQQIAKDHEIKFKEDRGHDLNSSISLALMEAWDAESKGVLVLPADVPMLDTNDLVDLIEASEYLTLPTGVMAMSDGGTNAMFWPVGVNFPPSFGEHSFSRFKAFTAVTGKPLITVSAAGLAFDVDTPEDFYYAKVNIPQFSEKLGDSITRLHEWISANPQKPAWEIELEEEFGIDED